MGDIFARAAAELGLPADARQKPPNDPMSVPQLFVIPPEIVKAMTYEEVEATERDMREMGLWKPPYQNFHIKVPGESFDLMAANFKGTADMPIGAMITIKVSVGPDGEHYFDAGAYDRYMFADANRLIASGKVTKELMEEYQHAMCLYAKRFCSLLYVSLSARNIIKETKVSKLKQLGIGNGKYNTITTIRIGTVTETVSGRDGEPRGTVRPHLRRGHIRRQHYGSGNKLEKRIFIAPVFVNADEDWVADRTAYNLSPSRRAVSGRAA